MIDKLIFTSFNEKYIKLGAALIYSIWNNTDSSFKIFVLDTGISERSKGKLIKWAIKKNRNLEILPINNNLFTHFLEEEIVLPEKIEYYSRLLVPYLAPKGVCNVLYLDADIICVSSLNLIFDIILQENDIVASCEDQHFKSFDHVYNKKNNLSIIPNYHELNFDGKTKYFNSGVLLINVEKWKKFKISSQVFEVTNKYKENVILYDQYALNIVLNGRWFNIDRRWNEMSELKKGYTIFRHFVKSKPIEFNSSCSDKKLFFEYLDLTPWKNWRPSMVKFVFAKFLIKFNNILKN
jgi:lipopolysaccharide biosynthesis glycosyltransferase